jgi:3-oxoacyl-[acyl-carrier-protein] synthase III
MMNTGGFRKALLLAGDISTCGITPKDKSTWPLFGDAGTATAIEYDVESKTYFDLQSDGTGYEAIIIPDGGLRNPLSDKTFIDEEAEPGVIRNRRNLWLNGLDVFNFSTREAPQSVNALLKFCGVGTDDQEKTEVASRKSPLLSCGIREYKFRFDSTDHSFAIKRHHGFTSKMGLCRVWRGFVMGFSVH